MGSSVPWSGERRESFACRDVLITAAAVACTPPAELTRQQALGVYIFSATCGADTAEAKPALLDGTRLPHRLSKLQPNIALHPRRARRRSQHKGLLERQQ